MPPFSALSDPTRAGIVEALAAGALSVGELVERFDHSQPAISRHLRILREAGLVRVRPDGPRRIYQLDPDPLRELDAWLERFRGLWAGKLDDLERFLEADGPDA